MTEEEPIFDLLHLTNLSQLSNMSTFFLKNQEKFPRHPKVLIKRKLYKAYLVNCHIDAEERLKHSLERDGYVFMFGLKCHVEEEKCPECGKLRRTKDTTRK